MSIGITGNICAGKGELTKILVDEYGYFPLSFGDEVRKEAQILDIEDTRENLQRLGHEMSIKHGEGYWSRRLIEKMEPGVPYVIEGFRRVGQIVPFRTLPSFALIGITAPYNVRLTRYLNRKRNEDSLTPEKFAEIDFYDRGSLESGVGQDACFPLRDYKIINDGDTVKSLENKAHQLLDYLASFYT